MDPQDARRLLDRIGVLRHACDLDLLIFFARHPRSLLDSESLARFLGYDLKEIAESLDVLLAARIITRTQVPTHAARLYVFSIDPRTGGADDDWLPSLLAFVSTRPGRLGLREALKRRQREVTNGPVAGTQADTRPEPRLAPVGIRPRPRRAAGA